MAKAPHVDRGGQLTGRPLDAYRTASEPVCTPEERALLDALGGVDGVRRQLWAAALGNDAFGLRASNAARALKRRDAAGVSYEQAWDELTGLEQCAGFPAGFIFDRLREMAEELPDAVVTEVDHAAGVVTIEAATPYDRAPDAPKSYSNAADVPDLSAVMVRHNDPFVRGHKPGPSAGPVLDGAAPAPAAVDPADAEKRRRMGL